MNVIYVYMACLLGPAKFSEINKQFTIYMFMLMLILWSLYIFIHDVSVGPAKFSVSINDAYVT